MSFTYVVNSKIFAEAPAETISSMVLELDNGEAMVPPVIDLVFLSLVHHSVIQQQATSEVNLLITMVETESSPPTQMVPKQGEGQPEHEIELSLILPTSSTSSSTYLVVVSEPTR